MNKLVYLSFIFIGIKPIFISNKHIKTYKKSIGSGVVIALSSIVIKKTYDKFKTSKNKKENEAMDNHHKSLEREKENGDSNHLLKNNVIITSKLPNDVVVPSQLLSQNDIIIPSQLPNNIQTKIKKTQFTMDDIAAMIPSECFLSRVINSEVINYFINFFNKNPDQGRILLLMASIKSSLKQILSIDLNARFDEWDGHKVDGRFFYILNALNNDQGYNLSGFLSRLRSAYGKDMADLIESHLSDSKNDIISKNVEKFAQFLQKDKIKPLLKNNDFINLFNELVPDAIDGLSMKLSSAQLQNHLSVMKAYSIDFFFSNTNDRQMLTVPSICFNIASNQLQKIEKQLENIQEIINGCLYLSDQYRFESNVKSIIETTDEIIKQPEYQSYKPVSVRLPDDFKTMDDKKIIQYLIDEDKKIAAVQQDLLIKNKLNDNLF